MNQIPVCPNCNIDMWPALYGMTAFDPAEKGFYGMGCLVDYLQVTFGCATCDYQILEDGTTKAGGE